MGFQDAVRAGFSNYATFTGRASRPEFWWFALFVFLGNIVVGLADRFLFGTGFDGSSVSLLGAIFGLVVLLPTVAVGVRRLHDIDKSGWWYLLILIPVLGYLIVIFFCIQRGVEGPNRFGPDPRSR